MATARRLGIASPRLGVFGINPHAGKDGLFGDDDERITKPAVAALRAKGIAADGPVGADLLLSERAAPSIAGKGTADATGVMETIDLLAGAASQNGSPT